MFYISFYILQKACYNVFPIGLQNACPRLQSLFRLMNRKKKNAALTGFLYLETVSHCNLSNPGNVVNVQDIHIIIR